MDSDWTVACAAGDPVVVVPWANADGSLRFVDLRSNPEAINEIQESQRYPVIAAALRRWSSTNGAMFTIKCDVWNYPARLFDAFDLSGFAHAHASYVDLISGDQNVFASFSTCEKLLRNGAEAARAVEVPNARCEWVLRPALIFDPGQQSGQQGFAVTLYVWGYGDTSEQAEAAWSAALLALVEPVARTMEDP